MKLYSQKLGKGDPLVILHGLFGSSDNWIPIGKKLAENFAVYLLDLRNHGKSPHIDNFGYDNMAMDVREYLEDHGLKKSILLGHSMGGKVAMKLALEYPNRLQKLIVADIAPRKYVIIHNNIVESLRLIKTEKLKSRSEADFVLANTIKSKTLRNFLLKNLYRDETGKFKWSINLEAICKNLDELGSEIAGANSYMGETLFIKGELSDYITERDKQDIETNFPNSEIVTIPGATHWLHAEQPELFFKAVSDFLNK